MRRIIPTPVPDDPLVTDAAALGRAIRAARTASGLTLVDAAAVLGIAKQTLSDLETARVSVGLALALRAAQALGVSVFAVPTAEQEPLRRMIRQVHAARDAATLAAGEPAP